MHSSETSQFICFIFVETSAAKYSKGHPGTFWSLSQAPDFLLFRSTWSNTSPTQLNVPRSAGAPRVAPRVPLRRCPITAPAGLKCPLNMHFVDLLEPLVSRAQTVMCFNDLTSCFPTSFWMDRFGTVPSAQRGSLLCCRVGAVADARLDRRRGRRCRTHRIELLKPRFVSTNVQRLMTWVYRRSSVS